jgi:toxin ParE1/3/4
MKPVIFDQEAEAEVRAAIAYYDGQRAGLGNEFRTAVEQAVAQIVQTPKAFSPYSNEGLRKFVMRRFPYNIYYLELDASIWVAAAAHQRRRPGYWAHRKP